MRGECNLGMILKFRCSQNQLVRRQARKTIKKQAKSSLKSIRPQLDNKLIRLRKKGSKRRVRPKAKDQAQMHFGTSNSRFS